MKHKKKRILLCKCFQESKLLQEYREKGLNENHNENVHFFQNFPEYDLASALGSNDVTHLRDHVKFQGTAIACASCITHVTSV